MLEITFLMSLKRDSGSLSERLGNIHIDRNTDIDTENLKRKANAVGD